MDRRNFIRRAGRYTLLTGMMAIGAFSICKRKKVPADACIMTGSCGTCAKLGSCSLPQAIRYKALQ